MTHAFSNSPTERTFTPREVVSELDKYIVGQDEAKRAVAVALRNRWRRQRVSAELRDEISPKNIILIGSTGVGKTEIARRIARLARAPFIKVEASKFTEVGYVGRDVDSMIRDLVEKSVQMVQDEERELVRVKAEAHAEERLLDLLLPTADDAPGYETDSTGSATRDKLRQMLREGRLNERTVETDAPASSLPNMQVLAAGGLEDMGMQLQDMMGQMMGGARQKTRKLTVPEAQKQFASEEADRLIDQDQVIREALHRAEHSGIVFLDEIDKIAGRQASGGPDVSREGVQRDILPIVEGSTVRTKYGNVKTDHMLFIAAGAFHVSKVSDLIPELQGRFPIRVELQSLGEAELLRIINEPSNSLPNQYAAMMKTEGVELEFSDEGRRTLARVAAQANARAENIGARRLHTVFERVLEDLSFEAPEKGGASITIDAAYVEARLKDVLNAEDLSRYIL